MILIGQYDSPFVRRVGIALTLYGMAFEHRPLSVFADAEAVRALNPTMRVPVLVLDDGTALIDSHMMLDHLDSLVDAPLFPRTEPARHQALKIAALGCGLAEKSVSLFYERRLHSVTSQVWETRCVLQIGSVIMALEHDLRNRPGPFWFGDDLTHADIAVACALRFTTEAHPSLPPLPPSLARHCAMMEAMPAFQTIAQPFAAPA